MLGEISLRLAIDARQWILRDVASALAYHLVLHLLAHLLAEESHLAPHVVVVRPDGEFLDLLRPLALSQIEYHWRGLLMLLCFHGKSSKRFGTFRIVM